MEGSKKSEPTVNSYQVVKLRHAFESDGSITASRPLCIVGPEKLRFNEALIVALPSVEFVHVIPHTTRAPRSDEVNGDDYYFVSMDEMNEGLSNKMFIEVGRYKVC